MKTVKAFKNSKGVLFESEKLYILSEAQIQRELILENWKRLTSIIKNKPELYFSFIKEIAEKAIDENITKESLQKQFNDSVELFSKEQKIKNLDYKNSGPNVEFEPYLWGNDILDGYDVNR